MFGLFVETVELSLENYTVRCPSSINILRSILLKIVELYFSLQYLADYLYVVYYVCSSCQYVG